MADIHTQSKAVYTVLDAADIKLRQERVVERVASTLCVSYPEASRLLRYYRWEPVSAEEAWFTDEARVRSLTGLTVADQPHIEQDRRFVCKICLDEHEETDRMTSLCQLHPFCKACFTRYIESAIKEGPSCLTSTCPEVGCTSAVLDGIVVSLVNESYASLYQDFLYRSFVEQTLTVKWCPGTGCIYAVEHLSGSRVVECRCKLEFCWDCLGEPHRPIDCDMARLWQEKNKSEKENTTWLVAYTKPCPKCKKPIEKDTGCMHMTCPLPCGHNFCWTCLASWSFTHAHQCDQFDEKREDDTKDKWNARLEISRYNHYFRRWHANFTSWKDSKQTLDRLKLHLGMVESELAFLVSGWEEIVRCRELLAWSYVYGYYFDRGQEARRMFFLHLQGIAQATLEQLHRLAHKATNAQDEVSSLKAQIVSLKKTCQTYFGSLLNALESGLQEVTCSEYESMRDERVAQELLQSGKYKELDRMMDRRRRSRTIFRRVMRRS